MGLQPPSSEPASQLPTPQVSAPRLPVRGSTRMTARRCNLMLWSILRGPATCALPTRQSACCPGFGNTSRQPYMYTAPRACSYHSLMHELGIPTSFVAVCCTYRRRSTSCYEAAARVPPGATRLPYGCRLTILPLLVRLECCFWFVYVQHRGCIGSARAVYNRRSAGASSGKVNAAL